MAVDILYFAWIREAIGKDGDREQLPDDVKLLTDLIAWLKERGGGYAVAFADTSRVRAAIDQRFVPLETEIGSATEIALFPPVTGG